MSLSKRCLFLRPDSLVHAHTVSLFSLQNREDSILNIAAFPKVLQTLLRTYHLPYHRQMTATEHPVPRTGRLADTI